ncbi:MAG: DNA translocase FtsK 4TM domain-containing protein [Parcubacteria group bacterium]|nr:DNA translocase FtsK 4TM domain-containing protein [Parcubacteria group bacterium]
MPKKLKKLKKKHDIFDKVPSLSSETWLGILSIVMLSVAVILALALFGSAGVLGGQLKAILENFSGWLAFVFPVLLGIMGYALLKSRKDEVNLYFYIGCAAFFLSLAGLSHLWVRQDQLVASVLEGSGGGYLGMIVNYPLRKAIGWGGTFIILSAVFFISVMLIFNKSLRVLWDDFKKFFGIGEESSRILRMRDVSAEPVDDEIKEDADEGGVSLNVKKLDDGRAAAASVAYKTEVKSSLPPLEEPKVKFKRQEIDMPLTLLKIGGGKPSAGNIKHNIDIIRNTLEHFKIPVQMGDVRVGPAVTQYMLKPSDGIKLNRLRVLSDDLALALAAHPVRIEAPIPGTPWVGVEVPNRGVAKVRLREVLETPAFQARTANLAIPLGKDVSGHPWVVDLEKMPHLLIAGATGSGKSVCLNAIILSLLYQYTPERLRFILVDPKRVELTVYNELPHLFTPVITDVKKTVNALKWLISEMERRYDILSASQKRNIQSYNLASAEKMPYILLIIDELADLMMAACSTIEPAIIRLAQMSRAVGIHLVLATQRPSVDVLTGLIKANIPARAAFSVASIVDSRTILDMAGADKLIGRGDMLFLSPELSKPVRIQGNFVDDEEIKNVVQFVKENLGEPQFVEQVVAQQKNVTFYDDADGDDDELLSEAKEVVIKAKKASTSYLQRKLRIGYARAARLMDLLEEQGVVGSADGAKPREVLIQEDAAFVGRDEARLSDLEEATHKNSNDQ